MSNSSGSLSMFDFTRHRQVISTERSRVNNTRAIFPRRIVSNDRRDRDSVLLAGKKYSNIEDFFCVNFCTVIIDFLTFVSSVFFFSSNYSAIFFMLKFYSGKGVFIVEKNVKN